MAKKKKERQSNINVKHIVKLLYDCDIVEESYCRSPLSLSYTFSYTAASSYCLRQPASSSCLTKHYQSWKISADFWQRAANMCPKRELHCKKNWHKYMWVYFTVATKKWITQENYTSQQDTLVFRFLPANPRCKLQILIITNNLLSLPSVFGDPWNIKCGLRCLQCVCLVVR